ncbi:MAG: hypothetical protein ACE15E_23330 [Acidobacteriota bacterium]
MRTISFFVLVSLLITPFAAGQQTAAPPKGSCEELTFKYKLPKEVGKRKRPDRLKWEDVDKILTGIREDLQGRECDFTFSALFRVEPKKDQVIYFPLTNNVLRTVPEGVLRGLQVFNMEARPLGQYDSRVPHERSGGGLAKKSYTLFSFQFKNPDGEYESVGGRLLLDEFLVKWDDIKEKVAITTR